MTPRMGLPLALVIILGCDAESSRRADPEPGILHVRFVDELVPADHGLQLRVRGTVEAPVARFETEGLRTTAFGLARHGKHLRVITTDALPELFREDVEAVVIGRWLTSDEARSIITARHLREDGDLFEARSISVVVPELIPPSLP